MIYRTDLLDETEMLAKLRTVVFEAGSQKLAAELLGVSTAYLNDVLHGRREPGDKILSALGMEKVVYYGKRSK